jgi:hypothetical protein
MSVPSTALLAGPVFSRHWAMPNGDTFTVPIIGNFVQKYLQRSEVSVDPFARNKRWATHTNDLNPATEAEHHMEARAFLRMLVERGVRADLLIFDPPYSPRQISEAYKGVGRVVHSEDTTSAFYGDRKTLAARAIKVGGKALCFGWNSGGFGKSNGFRLVEVLIVAHGGAHNDTICTVEIKEPPCPPAK